MCFRTPGPAVLLVLSGALRSGPAAGIWSSAGILSANAFYFALSATSLGAILIASYDLFFAIKWLGVAYLVYLGAKALLGQSSPISPTAGNPALVQPSARPKETSAAIVAAVHRPLRAAYSYA